MRIPVRVRVWAPVLGLMALVVALVASPLRHAWSCYQLHARGELAEAVLVGKDPRVELILEIASGPHAGSHCTAGTSDGHFAVARPGEVFQVILPEARPGDCVLVATLENSAWLLWGVGGGVAAVLLLLVLVGLLLQRSFTRPVSPSTRFDVQGMLCPRCEAPMSEGYLPILAGIHWREVGEPIGLPHVLAGLPGTVGWRGRPCLHAYRCAKCEVVTFRYGRPRR